MKINFDKIGMTASSICGIHCLLMPVIFVVFPYASLAFVNGKLFEWGFIFFSLIIASFALIQGFLVHKKWISLFLASLGFVIFIFVKLKYQYKGENVYESFIFVFAGMLICLSHFLNHKFNHNILCKCDR